MKKLIENLEDRTPRGNVRYSLIIAILYAIVVIINENFSVIAGLGLSPVDENKIKFLGAFLSVFLMLYNQSRVHNRHNR
jgi:hypothetical protein